MKGLEIERTLLKKDPSESDFYKSIRREGCESNDAFLDRTDSRGVI